MAPSIDKLNAFYRQHVTLLTLKVALMWPRDPRTKPRRMTEYTYSPVPL